MSQTVCILGRQPALGMAELESFFGAAVLTPIGSSAVIVDCDPKDFPINRFGGTVKACKLLTFLPTNQWQQISSHLLENVPKHLHYIPEGKIRLGLSCYGLSVKHQTINATALALKKVIKAAGRSVRVIPNSTNDLNTAQVLHNQLTGPTGLELNLISDGSRTVLAQTKAVQDIEAYAARDQQRPKRDARVGMLPPKLAQIIINLAVGQNEVKAVLDPFCGTGVLLQEALLLGYQVIGTDLEPRMIDYSRINLDWLEQTYPSISGKYKELAIGDATEHSWPSFDLIACETYLGRPFGAEPDPKTLNEVVRDVDTIHRKFLQNVARQTKPGLMMCIAAPAWKTRNGFKHLPTLDRLEELGYTRLSFVHAKTHELIYHRPEQIVARELVVLIRK